LKIASSQVAMSAARAYAAGARTRESLNAWQDGVGAVSLSRESATETVSLSAAAAKLSAELEATHGPQGPSEADARAVAPGAAEPLAGAASVEGDGTPEMRPIDKLNIAIVKKLFERFTGESFTLIDGEELAGAPAPDGEAGSRAPAASAPPSPPGEAVESVGWGLTYDASVEHYETERTAFAAEGVVRTRDGREIAITAELTMSRAFVSEEQVHFAAGDALRDPLVLNFEGAAAELTQTSFRFDLDADGVGERLPSLSRGSAFLVRDLNDDGVVNDGRELFGARTGDGFTELAEYDTDKNGWIDQADGVWGHLRLWSHDAAGNAKLIGLGDAGVGALYLGRASTPFALKDADQSTLGQVRSTGLFLYESGAVGTMQQVDLATQAVDAASDPESAHIDITV